MNMKLQLLIVPTTFIAALLGCNSYLHAFAVGANTLPPGVQKLCQQYPSLPICQGQTQPAPGGGTNTAMTRQTETTPAGSRNYYVYVPENIKNGSIQNAPAMVVLHGCTQSASDISAGTGMNAIADSRGFVVIYPEQTSQDNSQSCWNWYSNENLQRSGEAEIIASIASDVVKTYSLDPSRVFVSGMSAGAAMTSNLLACYSDVFAGGAIHSGLPFDAAENQMEALMAMQNGSTRDASAVAQRAYRCSPRRTRAMPVIIFHGDQDRTVAIKNARQNLSLFESINNEISGSANDYAQVTTEIPAAEAGGLTATAIDESIGGQPLLKLVTVHGMPHAWSGGSSAGSYTQPDGPNASQMIIDFLMPAPAALPSSNTLCREHTR